MPLKKYQVECLQEGVKKLYERMKHSMFVEKFTHDDYLQLFVPPSQRDMVVRAPMDAYVYGYMQAFQVALVDDGAFTVTLHDAPPCRAPLVPRGVRLLGDAPPELIARLFSWAGRRHNMAVQFAALSKLVDQLQPYSPKQVGHAVPGMMTVARAGGGDLLAKEMEGRPNVAPSLPAGLRFTCTAAATAIAVAQLLPEDLSATWDSPMTLELAARTMEHPVFGHMDIK
jgi:hypothetical protein